MFCNEKKQYEYVKDCAIMLSDMIRFSINYKPDITYAILSDKTINNFLNKYLNDVWEIEHKNLLKRLPNINPKNNQEDTFNILFTTGRDFVNLMDKACVNYYNSLEEKKSKKQDYSFGR